MHAKPLPEIAEADLKAVRDFLTSLRDEPPATHAAAVPRPAGLVPLRNGITRARTRSSRARRTS